MSPVSWRASTAAAAESIRSALASCSPATDSASSWRPSRDSTNARAARHGSSITVMPRVAATAASAARSAPVRSPAPLSAHAVWIQTP
jgi:hypothetical protein